MALLVQAKSFHKFSRDYHINGRFPPCHQMKYSCLRVRGFYFIIVVKCSKLSAGIIFYFIFRSELAQKQIERKYEK